jgi:phage shock protein B
LSWSVVLFVPAVIFVGLVMPIWLVLHYRQKSKDQSGLSSSDRADLEEMAKAADRMATRIGALEAILDSEISDWRARHQDAGSGNSASRRGGGE